MAEQHDKKTKHLRSARQWLTRAEESFEKDHEVRGELNLFLAQAELQHAQESNRSRRWIDKYPLLRHGLAVVVAVALVGAAYQVYDHRDQDRREHLSPASQPALGPIPTGNALTSPGLQNFSPALEAVPPASSVQPQPEKALNKTAVPESRNQPRQAESAVVSVPERPSPVSSEEMKNLIRAAGKSLRGE